jgi:Uma2 family endonuclease
MNAATIQATPTAIDPHPRLWTRDEYYRAGEMGLFEPDERLELIEGEVLRRMSPIGSPHRYTVYKLAHALDEALGPGYYVDQDVPLTISDVTEPQPDIVAAIGTADDYQDRHPAPADCILVVEVSDSTLAFDRDKKARLYASAGVSEYWIVNLTARRIEIYRHPTPDRGYQTTIEADETDSVAPLAEPEASVRVRGLMPRGA